ncbi:MAG: hypothetical protein JWR90_2557, partial [Marmoricola sp.]|nr:hypothetical protein [Marmoricola sp.]
MPTAPSAMTAGMLHISQGSGLPGPACSWFGSEAGPAVGAGVGDGVGDGDAEADGVGDGAADGEGVG